ncbi:paired box Pax-3 [Labeo rohita]|uniref:Paired box Pax-3 n=1 Tax=Labeo rohita TaxID=84645 RepID=A0A498NUK8_LABRO|nr:paired box Pax-3 [Labeo rohita]
MRIIVKVVMLLTGLCFLGIYKWKDISENVTVDTKTLDHIIDFFEQNYKSVGGDGHPRQYAVAINVEKDKCQQNFSPAQNNFLTQEDATNVKNAITDETNALYQGAELIAAGTRKVVISKKKQYNMHSESLLLNPADNSPMTKLLNTIRDGCSIFYTFKSPCVDSCLNETRNHNILNALKNWKEHDGIKAFVFKDIWKFDTKKIFRPNLSRLWLMFLSTAV